MSLLVTGSIGIDTVTTPYGRRDNWVGRRFILVWRRVSSAR
jgi:hypothetical protein